MAKVCRYGGDFRQQAEDIQRRRERLHAGRKWSAVRDGAQEACRFNCVNLWLQAKLLLYSRRWLPTIRALKQPCFTPYALARHAFKYRFTVSGKVSTNRFASSGTKRRGSKLKASQSLTIWRRLSSAQRWQTTARALRIVCRKGDSLSKHWLKRHGVNIKDVSAGTATLRICNQAIS